MFKKKSVYKILLAALGFTAVYSSIPASTGFHQSDQPERTRLTNPYASLYQAHLEDFTRKGHPGVGVLIRTPEEGTWNGAAGSGMEGMAQTRYFPTEGVTISAATNVGSTNRPNAHEHFNGLFYDLTNAVFNLRSSRTTGSRGVKFGKKAFKKTIKHGS